jgi:GNAT superfamily N-acetyltransferase
VTVRLMGVEDVPGAVALQRACFPPPFPAEFHWRAEHLMRHLSTFSAGQFIAVEGGTVIGCASNCIISEARWLAHRGWSETVGGPFVENHDPTGTTLYGLDVSVHPDWQGKGVGRALYFARFDLVRALKLERYGTACRLPGFLAWSRAVEAPSVENYVAEVVGRRISDRTLTPMLRYGLRFVGVIHDYMTDDESADAAALLVWEP